MPRNGIFLTFTHQAIQPAGQVVSVTGPNPSPTYVYLKSIKMCLTGSSSPDYICSEGRGSIPDQPLSLLHLSVG